MYRGFQIGLLSCFLLSFCLIDYNRRNIGIREATGNNDGEYIRRFVNYCGLHGDGYEWCAAYTLAGHKECNLDFPKVNPCRADSWFDSTHTVYKKGDSKSLIKEGQVAGYWVQSKGRIGHNGTIISVNDNYALVVEGNSRDAGNVLQSGDGVHLLRRSLDEITATSDWRDINISRFHIVQPKETLYRISLMYKTTVGELIRINNLKSNILTIGQRVKVK